MSAIWVCAFSIGVTKLVIWLILTIDFENEIFLEKVILIYWYFHTSIPCFLWICFSIKKQCNKTGVNYRSMSGKRHLLIQIIITLARQSIVCIVTQIMSSRTNIVQNDLLQLIVFVFFNQKWAFVYAFWVLFHYNLVEILKTSVSIWDSEKKRYNLW